MFENNETDSKEPGIVKHSINTLIFRSLKRTHDLFIASESLPVPQHDLSSAIRKTCKLNSEYSAVKLLPPPSDTIARMVSRRDSASTPLSQTFSETGGLDRRDIPMDSSGREALRGDTALVPARDSHVKSALALKAITTEKVSGRSGVHA